MTHIEAYVLATIHAKQLNMSNSSIAAVLSTNFDINMTEYELPNFLGNKPKTKHVVCELIRQGYRQEWIAKVLGFSQPTISYHLSNPPKRDYQNPFILTKQAYRIRSSH